MDSTLCDFLSVWDMLRPPRGALVVQLIAIGLVLTGIGGGLVAHESNQSSSYMVAGDAVSPSGSVASYEDRSPSKEATVDRITATAPTDRQAAQARSHGLPLLTEKDVQYQGKHYSFEMHYNPTPLGQSYVLPTAITVGGGVLLFLVAFQKKRQ